MKNIQQKKGLWYLLPFSVREKLEVPSRYDVRKELEIILDDFGGKKIEILDAGAGDCFAKRFFTGENYKYTAMDFSDGCAVDNPLKLDVFGDVQNIPFENNKFNLVLCLEVLEYVSDPQKAVSELFRVLKKNGVLLVSMPLMVGFHNDLYRFTPPALKLLIERAGFKIKKIKSVGGFYRLLGWQIAKLGYRGGKPKNKFFWPFYYIIKISMGLIFQIIIPFFLFHLDWLDKEKTETFGYIVVASKKII